MGDDFKAKGGKLQGEGYPSMGGYKECTKGELAKFKHQLLTYHCQRFEEPHCQLEVKEGRVTGRAMLRVTGCAVLRVAGFVVL